MHASFARHVVQSKCCTAARIGPLGSRTVVETRLRRFEDTSCSLQRCRRRAFQASTSDMVCAARRGGAHVVEFGRFKRRSHFKVEGGSIKNPPRPVSKTRANAYVARSSVMMRQRSVSFE